MTARSGPIPFASALRNLRPAESLLIAYAKERHHEGAKKPTPGAQLATALKGAKDAYGSLLPYLPETMCGSIEAHLDAGTKQSLTQTWVGRLQPRTQQAVLNKAAKAYGFTSPLLDVN